MFNVTETPISVDNLIQYVRRDNCGAIAVFIGTVRDNSRGMKIKCLEYDAYKGMAEKKLKEIYEEAKKKWEIGRIAISHRLGLLEIGEISVVIAVSAPHRNEAFEACRYAIEQIKEIVPIWKKEMGEDGTFWIEGDFAISTNESGG